jgi:ubiquinone/menaquinone biosynthesis C-methylase UbiE
LSNEDVLDLACGTGFYTRIIKTITTGKVYGIDISEDMINHAQT